MLENISYEVEDYGKAYYSETAPVMNCARPFKMVHPEKDENRICILGLHGYTGYSGELVSPGLVLYDAGFDFYVPRYPGHGTSRADFLKTDSTMWINTAKDAYKDLCGKYKTVYLIGHSMGGAIAVLLGHEFRVKRIVLLSPALDIPMLKWWLKPLSWFVKQKKVEWSPDLDYKLAYENAPSDDLAMGKQYWSAAFPHQSWELKKIMEKGVKVVSGLDSEVLVLWGDRDQTVSSSVFDIVKTQKGRTEAITVKNGTHLLPYDKDDKAREFVLKATVEWFSCCKIL